MGVGLATPQTIGLITLLGAALLAAYVWHAMRVPEPLIDLNLLKIPTYRAGVIGGFLFRVGLGAGPFLLPLLFQAGFGLTAFQSGMLTFATGVGALFMKTQVATSSWRALFNGCSRSNRAVALYCY